MTPRPARVRPQVALALTAALTAALGLAGCSGSDEPDAQPSSSRSSQASSASATPTPTPVDLAPAPRTGQCRTLTQTEAIAPTAPAAPVVACTAAHTAQTYRVGELDLVREGHLLAVDSTVATRQVQRSCQGALGGWLGGDPRLSVLTPIWFTPSVEQSDVGAAWFRCDVVALGAGQRLAELPDRTKGLLATRAGRDRFGLCRTAAPAAPGSAPVPCSAKHTFRALRAVDLPGTTLPTPKAGQAILDPVCRQAATEAARDPLDIAWQQELPTAEQWAAGRRHGLCWVPA